jgi:hypothetical protein
MSPDERVALNQELLQQYGSQIFVPRAAESRILIRMVYPLNKAIPRLRRDLGVTRTIADVAAILDPVLSWVKEAADWLRQSGGDLILMTPALGESTDERKRMAKNPRAHVIVPQTEEVRQVLEQIMRMDRVLVMLRMISMEQLRDEPRLGQAFELVRGLDEAVRRVCDAVRVEYFEPRELRGREPLAPRTGLPDGLTTAPAVPSNGWPAVTR